VESFVTEEEKSFRRVLFVLPHQEADHLPILLYFFVIVDLSSSQHFVSLSL